MAEQDRFDNYFRWLNDYFTHAKAELSPVEFEQLCIQLIQQHKGLKRAAQAAAFVELPA